MKASMNFILDSFAFTSLILSSKGRSNINTKAISIRSVSFLIYTLNLLNLKEVFLILLLFIHYIQKSAPQIGAMAHHYMYACKDKNCIDVGQIYEERT